MNTYNIYDISNTEIELLATIQAENIKEVAEYVEKDKFYNRYVWLKIENEKKHSRQVRNYKFLPFLKGLFYCLKIRGYKYTSIQ